MSIARRFLILLVFAVLASCASDGSSPIGLDSGDGDRPTPRPEGVLLDGDPDDDAIGSTALLPPSVVPQDDVDGHRLMTRLTGVIATSATVAAVNEALEAEDVRIVTMIDDFAAVTLKTPRLTSRADAEALAGRLVASGAFSMVFPARQALPEPIPDDVDLDRSLPDVGDTGIDHLTSSVLHGAWNLKRRATSQSNRVTVLIPDFYTSNTPLAEIGAQSFGDSLGPGAVAASPDPAETDSHTGNHGYHVSGIVGANFDATGPTGVNPDPTQLLDIRSFQVAGLNTVDWAAQIANGFPASGSFLLSTSLGMPGYDPYTTLDYIRLYVGAVAWRRVAKPHENRFLHMTAAGNEAQSAGDRSQARYGSEFSAASRWDDLRQLVPVDSLTAADQAAIDDLWNVTTTSQPATATRLTNVVIVGACDDAGQESSFSNPNPDVHAPGERVFAPCAVQDPGYPANADYCDGATARYSGTSMATPLVAGIAAYLWNLDPTASVAELREVLVQSYDQRRAAGRVDAYAAALALDDSVNDAPMRRTLLDVAGSTIESGPNGRFDQVDIEAYLFWFESYRVQADETGDPDDFSRYDLNGDRSTGYGFTNAFDLNFDGLMLGTVTFEACGVSQTLDERDLTDRDVLLYYAYSALYEGDEDARDALLCAGRFVEFTERPDRLGPEESGEVTIRVGSRIGDTTTPSAGIALRVVQVGGSSGTTEAVTDANGEFTLTVTMPGLDSSVYTNALRIVATATFDDDEQLAGETSILRRNQIVLRSRRIEMQTHVSFQYNENVTVPGAEVIIESRVDSTSTLEGVEPFELELSYDETGSGNGMTARTKLDQWLRTTISGTAEAFTGASFEGRTQGFARLDNPDFDVDSYHVRSDGESETTVDFEVYGDPATWSITGSLVDSRIHFVWLFGPDDPYSCQYDEGCNSVGGSGTLAPGRYAFVAIQRDFGLISWCEDCEWPVISGQDDGNGSLSATLSVSH